MKHKFLTRMAAITLGLAMAVGVGVGVANNRNARPVYADTENVVFTVNVETGGTTLSKDGVDVSTTSGTFSRTDNYRVYANNSMTISSNYSIVGMAFTITQNNFTADVGTWDSENKTWSGSANSVTLSASGGQVRFTTFTVTISDGNSGGDPIQLSAPTNLSASGPILSWNNVENNSGYSYSINTTPEATTGNIAKNATSFNADSLPLNPGTYTFALKTKGNGESYLDSDYCEAVSFTISEYSVDTFTVSDFAATGGSYTVFSISGTSGSTYVGYSAKPSADNDGYIQFNNFSDSKNRSIATSTSCGYIRRVSVTWGNANGKEFTVYVGDSAYSSSSIANTGTAQTNKLTSSNTIVAISGNNRHVSLYPSGAIYPASVSFYWEPVLENQTITASAESAREDETITVSSNATSEVTWSIVSGAGTTATGAAVTSAGIVSVTGPGTVTVKASAQGYHDATKQLTFTEKPAGTYYTITFDEDGGSNSPDDKSVLEGTTFVFPSAGTKEHYTFLGWTADGDSFYAEGATSPAVTSDADYLAWWEEDAKYTVTYNAGLNGSGSYAHANNYVGTYELLPFASLTGVSASAGYRFKNYTVGGVNKNAGDTFSLSGATEVTVNFELIPPTDVLTAAYINQASYDNWSGKAGSTTDAIYAGNSSTSSNGAIQMRTSNSNSGIVSTASGGKIRKVVIEWDAAEPNNDGKTIDVYAKNTAYSAATELYSAGTQGTKIGSITYTNSTNYQTELTISGNYRYVGIRSNKNAIYLSQVNFEWEPLTAQEKVEDLSTNTKLSYHYSKNEDIYSYSTISIRFGGLLSQSLWNELDTNEHNISGFGVMITAYDQGVEPSYSIKDHLDNAVIAEETPDIDTKIVNHYMQIGDGEGQMEVPPVSSTNYYWNLFFSIDSSDINKFFTAAAYIKVGDDYVFFKQIRYSVKSLASDYITNRGCNAETAGGSLANLAA